MIAVLAEEASYGQDGVCSIFVSLLKSPNQSKRRNKASRSHPWLCQVKIKVYAVYQGEKDPKKGTFNIFPSRKYTCIH